MAFGYNLDFTGRVAAIALAAFVGGTVSTISRAADAQVDFNKDIQPILKNSCVKCHSQDPRNAQKKPAGGLRLDDKELAMKGGKSGKAIEPGKADDSLLYKVLLGPVNGDHEVPGMPKAMRGQPFKPLPKEKIALIKAWIDQGANWGK
jgi:hypothetical protein